MTYTEKDKIKIYKWRNNNMEVYQTFIKNYNDKNRELILFKKAIAYQYKKDNSYNEQTKVLRKCLL